MTTLPRLEAIFPIERDGGKYDRLLLLAALCIALPMAIAQVMNGDGPWWVPVIVIVIGAGPSVWEKVAEYRKRKRTHEESAENARLRHQIIELQATINELHERILALEIRPK